MATVRLNGGSKEPPVDYTPAPVAPPEEKSLGQKLKGAIVASSMRDVKDWVIFDVLIPGAKNLFINAIDMALNGRLTGGRNGGNRYYYGGNTSYENYYRSQRNPRQDDRDYINYARKPAPRSFDYKCIVGRNRMAAIEIVDRARAKIKSPYGTCSKADLYEIIEDVNNNPNFGYFAFVPEPNGVDRDWGWIDVNDICIRGVTGGYLIDLADAKYFPDIL